jgi:hypothetical protein
MGKMKYQVMDIEEMILRGADAREIKRVLDLKVPVEEVAKIMEEMKEDNDQFE